MDEDEIILNVGGTVFITFWETLQKYPNTKLGSLTEDSPHYRKDKHIYFFDRNPELFNTILDFYRNDTLHFPNHLCSGLWHQELRYWGLSIRSTISECCYSTYVKYCKNDTIIQNLRKALDTGSTEELDGWDLENLSSSEEYISTEYVKGIRVRMWNFLSEPRSSTQAKIYNGFYFTVVFLSALSTLLITMPELRSDNRKFPSYNISDVIRFLKLDENNTKQMILETREIPEWLMLFDLFLAFYFAIEFLFRVCFCPDKRLFFKDWLNILDALLFTAIMVRVMVDRNPGWFLSQNSNIILPLYKICNCITVFRIFRFLRLAKQFSGLYVLVLALKASWKELMLFFFTILLFALLFANCIFYAEMQESTTFPNLLYGLWWAIITLTTVGYGDHVPKSPIGQVIGSFCAICGIIVLAMPVAMIVANFNEYYQRNRDRQQFMRLKIIEKKKTIISI
ncbi:KCNC1 [Mytilus edulis]|uniref:KCNC1 n=1 Tax=Mytilus edulis TaxID=6550 RepID=A0A8S3UXV0_MYTED|nr:KCNC1 [Mytilus edulis]